MAISASDELSSPPHFDLAKATINDFGPLVGQRFELAFEEGGQPVADLILAQATALRHGMPGGRAPFCLVFDGPPDKIIGQGLVWLKNMNTGEAPIFVVPISGNAEKRCYEAVFN